jgi:predicted GNAT superfamily acetyltransferase
VTTATSTDLKDRVTALPEAAPAIEAAETAARAAGVFIRELTELAEMEQGCRLYEEIWAPESTTPISTEMMRALSKAGNYVAGAFDGGALVGLCVGMFCEPASRSLHSHIAGISPRAQTRRIGFALKTHQRAWALLRGISSMSWTFDPLVRRNAYFNLSKLAAVPVEYLYNFYGDMHDRINGDDRSDRLLVGWDLTAGSVVSACGGSGVRVDANALRARGAAIGLGHGPDGEPRRGRLDADTLLIAVPDDIEKLRATDPTQARAWREALSETLGAVLVSGAPIVGFDRTGWYVVGPRT